MGLEVVIAILKIADMAAQVAVNYGVDMQRFHELQAKARAEGRGLTESELLLLADDAQAAIDAIGSDPTP